MRPKTALLAKNVLRFGVPVAWDGVNLVSQECGADYDANYLWRQDAVAAHLSHLGLVRAPRRFHRDRPAPVRPARASLGALDVFSRASGLRRPTDRADRGRLADAGRCRFLLHVRQGRYYALAIFAAIWALSFFFMLPARRRLAAAGLALTLTALLHTSHLLFFAVAAGLVLGFVVIGFDRAVFPWLASALIAAAVVGLPWMVGADLGEKSGFLLARNSPQIFAGNLGRYAARVELYAFPALLLTASLVGTAAATRARLDLRAPWVRTCLFPPGRRDHPSRGGRDGSLRLLSAT
jgi:hypothetical protein